MFNAIRTLSAKTYAAATAAALTVVASPAFAQAGDPVGDLFEGINLGTVATAVGAVGLVVIGIVMAFKAVDLAKRAVSKA